MPRIMISATGTNCGKTSIVCGLLKILKDRGMNVKAYKCGPDYIDGMFHKEVLGVESSNLDSFFCNKDQLCALLDNDKDLNVIEGGMGFYDGVGFEDKGSCYDISKLTNTPVVLIINCKGMSSSIGATLRGFIEYRQDNQILGVIFNRLSPNLFEGCKEVALSLGIVPLGYIPDIKEGLFDSRYLGLVTPENIDEYLGDVSGILVPGGFGDRGIDGMICAIRYAREHQVPFLGLCLGMQLSIVEFARDVIGWNDAHSVELDPATTHPVIHLMPDQDGIEDIGGTLRLGSYPCVLDKNSKAYGLYGEETIHERHRHRYEVNNDYRTFLTEHGMMLSGMSPDNRIVEMIELPDHPWFVGTQAHPELKSRPNRPHPLFKGFIEASLKNQDK